MSRSCPACTTSQAHSFGAIQEQSYVRCGQCKSIYCEHLPFADDMAALYPESYGADRGHGGHTDVAGAKAQTFEEHLRLIRSTGRLLEIGCSAGDALAVARNLGWESLGIEPNAQSAAIGNARLGPGTIHCGDLASYPTPDTAFDAAALFDVVEHFPEPEDDLRRLAHLLKPGAQVLLVTPDANSLTATLLRSRWPHFIREHLCLFSKAGLKTLLQRCGYRVTGSGQARKYLSPGMLEHHFTLYPHTFMAGTIRKAAKLLPRVNIRTHVGQLWMLAELDTTAAS